MEFILRVMGQAFFPGQAGFPDDHFDQFAAQAGRAGNEGLASLERGGGLPSISPGN